MILSGATLDMFEERILELDRTIGHFEAKPDLSPETERYVVDELREERWELQEDLNRIVERGP